MLRLEAASFVPSRRKVLVFVMMASPMKATFATLRLATASLPLPHASCTTTGRRPEISTMTDGRINPDLDDDADNCERTQPAVTQNHRPAWRSSFYPLPQLGQKRSDIRRGE
jgi:hypothetical protein